MVPPLDESWHFHIAVMANQPSLGGDRMRTADQLI
jgi:hypothetical protein